MAKRKFQLGDVVFWIKPITGLNENINSVPYYGVVVDYTQDGTGRGEYRVQRVLHPVNGGAIGPAVWVAPHHLLAVDYPRRKRNVRIYRANKRLVERDCSCNCCAHEAIPHHALRKDGSVIWDDPE